jgi:hypothetical protein
MADGSIFSPTGRAMGRRELEAMGVDTSKYETEGIAKKTYIITDPDIKDLTVIGKGGYGCVVKPVKKCKDDDTNQTIKREEELGKKYVSKIFYDQGSSDENKELVEMNISNNEIARRASSKALSISSLATEDLGMELYDCELERPQDISGCGAKRLSEQSLILLELGGLDAQEIKGRKRVDLLRDLVGITYEDIERAINSNLINISQLHSLGYVDLDLKLGNILPNFEKPFSFKIIDYDMFQKKDSKNAFGYFHAKYFFPPEYIVYGKLLFERRPSVSTLDILNWLQDKMDGLLVVIRNFGYYSVEQKIRELIYNAKPAVKADKDEAWIKMYRDNTNFIVKLHSDVIARTDKTKYDVKRFIELTTSVDYFMYGIAMYTFVYEIKQTKPKAEQDRWDELLEKLSRFFNPTIDYRLIAIDEFLTRGTI